MSTAQWSVSFTARLGKISCG